MMKIISRENAAVYPDCMRRLLFLVLLFAALAGGPSRASGACTVCHSKNPKMVRMHEALRFKDCFVCHKPGGISAGPGLKEQMVRDQRCVSCHAVQKGAVPAPSPAP